MTVWTIGHSTRSFEVFVAALRSAGCDAVGDVRRIPRSRRHPQFNADALGSALAEVDIDYFPLPELGGRRGARRDSPSPNGLWREEGFRNYADYAETEIFHAEFDRLRALTERHRIAVMCAEAVWWRCHRRIITDYLLAAGETVMHILDVDKIEPARLTPGAVALPDGGLRYPPEQPSLF